MTEPNFLERVADDIRSALPPDAIPEEPSGDLFLIYAVLALSKGEQVRRRDVHNAWVAWMTGRDPTHDSIRPYDELALDVQEEDDPYVTAIRRVARSHSIR